MDSPHPSLPQVVVILSRIHIHSTMLKEHLGNRNEMDIFESLVSTNASLD
jgi:hypothetical protein